MPTVVDSSNPIYDALRERWVATGRGSTLTVNGRTFRELDNGARFVRIDVEQGSPDSMNAMYASTAIRPVEPLTITDEPKITIVIHDVEVAEPELPLDLGIEVEPGDEDAARNGLPQGSDEAEGSQEDEGSQDNAEEEVKVVKPRKPRAKKVSNDEQPS